MLTLFPVISPFLDIVNTDDGSSANFWTIHFLKLCCLIPDFRDIVLAHIALRGRWLVGEKIYVFTSSISATTALSIPI